jgi:protein ImuB
MTLADARAAIPALAVAEADPTADAEDLSHLADWCGHWTPWTATDGSDGIVLDVTGCAHLFGGEVVLLEQMCRRLRRLGFAVRAALAEAPAGAWAWARYGGGGVLPVGQQSAALSPLPISALRLSASLVHELEHLGLSTIATLTEIPRASLASRFESELLHRLDQLSGRRPEPIGPRPPPADWTQHRSFAEPIGRREDIDASLRLLLRDLAADLAAVNRGVRQLTLTIYRVDGSIQRRTIGTARPSRAADHLARLFAEQLGGLDPGFGIEAMKLTAPLTEPSPAYQLDWQGNDAEPDALVHLIDRLQQRLDAGGVVRVAPIESHLPERAVAAVAPLAEPAWTGWTMPLPRPLRLLPTPEPITVTAPVPDDPPVAFRWRRIFHRVARAEGPERIAAEWWRATADEPARDYYWVEDAEGRRYWMFRNGPYTPGRPVQWYLHGLYA